MQLDEYRALPYTIILKADADGDWVAEIDELEGCVAHGESQEEALRRLEESKALWIEESLAHGQPIPKPDAIEPLPSGRWLQRVPRSLHKNLSRLAKIEGVSLNQLVTSILSVHLGTVKGPEATARAAQAMAWHEPRTEHWVITGQVHTAQALTYLRVLSKMLPGHKHVFREEIDAHTTKR